jgi:hypothetical protein
MVGTATSRASSRRWVVRGSSAGLAAAAPRADRQWQPGVLASPRRHREGRTHRRPYRRPRHPVAKNCTVAAAAAGVAAAAAAAVTLPTNSARCSSPYLASSACRSVRQTNPPYVFASVAPLQMPSSVCACSLCGVPWGAGDGCVCCVSPCAMGIHRDRALAPPPDAR